MLPGTNALAYYEKSELATVKSFIKLVTGVNTYLNLSFNSSLKFHLNKLERLHPTGPRSFV
jgi:hypothetical protein